MWKYSRPGIGMLLTILFTASAVQAEDAATVKAALVEMQAWVGDDANGAQWQRYLRTEQLEAQLSLGRKADRASVEDVLDQYQRDVTGLDRWRFVAVREALEGWIASLPVEETSLTDSVLQYQDRYAPVTDEVVQRRAGALRAALDRLDQFLALGNEENAQRWKRYLQWNNIDEQLASQDQVDLAVLQESLMKFYENHEGLAMKQFTDVREKLRSYMNAQLFHGEPRAKEVYSQRIEELAKRLGESEVDRDNVNMIGRIVGWLESGDQAPSIVKRVRQKFDHPNFYGRMSENLLAAGIGDDVSQVQSVNEFILGTTIQGTANLVGALTADVVPAKDSGAFDIVMEGTAYSDNVGYNGPVTLYSSGVTGLYASKRVFVTEEGLTWNAAWANGWTSSTIHSIAARSKLIRKIAWKRAGSSKSQAESVAAGRAASRVAGEVDAQAADLLAEVNTNYEEMVRRPLQRLDAFPRRVRFSSNSDSLQVRVLHASPYQLAAPNSAPPIEVGHDLSARLHESVVGNFSESILGGKTLTDERLEDLMSESGAEVPEELQIGPDKDPWSITFSSNEPIAVRFQDQSVRIAILGRRFTRGEQQIRDTIEIAAVYDLENTGNGSRLTRRGEVEVEYVSRRRLSVSQVAMKTFLRKKFDALFKAEIVSEGLELSGRWEKVGRLQLRQLASQEGWLSLDWQMPAEEDTIRTASAEERDLE